MYSEYIASALQSSELPEAAQDALRNLFGNCSIDLNHKAPVTIEVPNAENSSINYQTFLNNITNEINNHTDEYYYAFSPQLYSYIDNSQTIQGGFNMYVPGVNYFQTLMVTDLILTDVTFTENDIDYCLEDVEVVTDASLSYSFNSSTCYLTLTLTLTKEEIKVFKECP